MADTANHRLFVGMAATPAQIAVIDGRAFTVTDRITVGDVSSPGRLAYDSGSDRLFIGNYDSVQVLDLKTRQIMINIPPGQTASLDSAKQAADAIMAQLRAGADFATTARAKSSDPRNAVRGGEAGWLDLISFTATVREAIAKAPVGSLVGPIQTPLGYEILLVEARSNQFWVTDQLVLAGLQQQLVSALRQRARERRR